MGVDKSKDLGHIINCWKLQSIDISSVCFVNSRNVSLILNTGLFRYHVWTMLEVLCIKGLVLLSTDERSWGMWTKAKVMGKSGQVGWASHFSPTHAHTLIHMHTGMHTTHLYQAKDKSQDWTRWEGERSQWFKPSGEICTAVKQATWKKSTNWKLFTQILQPAKPYLLTFRKILLIKWVFQSFPTCATNERPKRLWGCDMDPSSSECGWVGGIACAASVYLKCLTQECHKCNHFMCMLWCRKVCKVLT